MSMSVSMSGIGGSSFSGLGLAKGGVSRIGLGHGAGSGLGLGAGSGLGFGAGSGLGFGAGSGLGLGAGSGLGLGAGSGLMMGLGLGGRLGGLGLGMGAGAGMGLGAGAMGLGGGAGAGMGLGGGLNMGMGGGLGGGGGGALVPSPAFTMGRAITVGGVSAGSAMAAKSEVAPIIAVLTRADEKSVLSGLNDRFSAYMAKVKALQQENTSLEAKLSQLTGGTGMSPDTSEATTEEYEAQLTEYRNTLESLTLDTIKLEIDLDNIRATANDLKIKFEFEQGVKAQLEVDISAMKKDIETASDMRIDLDAKQSSLKNELDYVTKTQIEELASLHTKLGSSSTEKSVAMIEVDTGKSFDIATALSKLRTDYEKAVLQHKEEADAYYKLKMDEIHSASEKTSEAMSIAKEEIMVSKKAMQALHLELQSLITSNITLEQNLSEAQALSTTFVTDCQSQIASLESAIELAKVEFQKQSVSYRELLDIKLALDIEISTYRKLLEADDFSMPLKSGPESSFVFSTPPDPFSQFKSPPAEGTSSPEPSNPSMDLMSEEPEKMPEEQSNAKESPPSDAEAEAAAQESATGEQTESSTHSDADDSES